MFDDRRQKTDRRVQRDPTGIPPGGCRRSNDRRDRSRRYQAHPWWLLTEYVEELEPPELHDQRPESERSVDGALSSWFANLRRRKGLAAG